MPNGRQYCVFKGIVQPEMKMLSLFTQPHVIPNRYFENIFWKEDALKNISGHKMSHIALKPYWFIKIPFSCVSQKKENHAGLKQGGGGGGGWTIPRNWKKSLHAEFGKLIYQLKQHGFKVFTRHETLTVYET